MDVRDYVEYKHKRQRPSGQRLSQTVKTNFGQISEELKYLLVAERYYTERKSCFRRVIISYEQSFLCFCSLSNKTQFRQDFDIFGLVIVYICEILDR